MGFNAKIHHVMISTFTHKVLVKNKTNHEFKMYIKRNSAQLWPNLLIYNMYIQCFVSFLYGKRTTSELKRLCSKKTTNFSFNCKQNCKKGSVTHFGSRSKVWDSQNWWKSWLWHIWVFLALVTFLSFWHQLLSFKD